MRRLGRPRVAATGTRGAFGASLVALTLLLAGCGSDNPTDSGSGEPSATPSSETTPPTPAATPSVLEGGTRLDGPAFDLTIPSGYELINRDNGGEYGEWSRAYSLHINVVTFIMVTHVTQSVLPLDEELENVRGYLTMRGISRDRIRRGEDLALVGQPTARLIGTSPDKEVHAYVVDLGSSYLELFLERAPEDTKQERTQQAMLDSIRLTGS